MVNIEGQKLVVIRLGEILRILFSRRSGAVADLSIPLGGVMKIHILTKKIAVVVSLIFAGISFPALAQHTLPGSAPAGVRQPSWQVVVSSGAAEYYATADQACARQHQSYNPNATYQSPEYRSPSAYNCRWKARQYGGPANSNTILPTIVTLACPSGFVWTRSGQCVNSLDNEPEHDCMQSSQPVALGPAPLLGNPVCITTGAKIEFQNDYQTADGLFGVSRKYRSRQHQMQRYAPASLPGFGPNWHGIIPSRLAVYGYYTEKVEYLDDAGGVDYFSAPTNSQNNYNYYTVGGGRRKLEAISVPSDTRSVFFRSQPSVVNGPAEFKLTQADGGYTLYRRSGTWSSKDEIRYLIPIAQVFPGGYTRYFDYEDVGQYPSKVRDSFGRQLELIWIAAPMRSLNQSSGNYSDYAGMEESKVISKIILPDNTALIYSYSDTTNTNRAGREDRLIKASHQDAAGNELWAKGYLYENPNFPYALTGIVDMNGSRLSTYTYHSYGLVKSSEKAGGIGKLEINYTSTSPETYAQTVNNYRLVTNPLGHEEVYRFWRYSYVAPGNMPAVLVSVYGNATSSVPSDSVTFGYEVPSYSNAVRLLTQITDRRGVITTFTNDRNNRRPTKIVEAASTSSSRTSNVQWHPAFDLPVQTEVAGLRTQISYNETGQILSWSRTDTTANSLPYSSNGQVRTESYTWSDVGQLLAINGPKPVNDSGQDDITTFAYDAEGNLITMTNPLGHVTSYSDHDANGRVGKVRDPNGAVTEFFYDKLGRLLEAHSKDPSEVSPDSVTKLEYDIEGRVVGLTMPQIQKLKIVYDLAGQVTSLVAPNGESITFEHDAMGNITKQEVKRSDGSASSVITRSFDSLGRLLSQTLGPDRATNWAYDKSGNAIRHVSPRSFAMDSAFDPLNRVISTLAPDTGATRTVYDTRDNITSFQDSGAVTTTFVRNGFGEIIQETSPDRGTSIFYYDANGDVDATIDALGQRTDYSRDLLGRVLTVTPADRPDQKTYYQYDTPSLPGSYSIGRLSGVVSGGVEVRLAYDFRGNVVVKDQRIDSGDWLRLSVKYDLGGHIIQEVYPSGRIIDYSYDGLGRVNSVRTKKDSNALSWNSLSSDMQYEPFSALKSAKLGEFMKLSVDWGDDQRLASKRVYRSDSGSDIWHNTYDYDPDDNIISITDVVNPANSRKFGYDSMGRLSRMEGALGSFGRVDYVHDRNGNPIRVERRIDASDAVAANTDIYSLAAGSNRIESIEDSRGARNFTHDARGNLTSDERSGGASVTVTYDRLARLVGFRNAAGDIQKMRYNGLDERVQVATTAVGGQTNVRSIFYDLHHRIIGEYGAGGVSDTRAEYVWMLPQVGGRSPFGGNDGADGYMPLAVSLGTSDGATHIAWTHGNHLGTPLLTTDATGDVVDPIGYAQIGFPGQWRSAQTIAGADFYYNRYRDYDSTIGRYIQADPIGLAGGMSPYSYANNNPIRYTDTQGLFIDALVDLGFIGYDLYRIGKDNVFGDICSGTLNANLTALGFDVAGLVIPGVTGLGAASRVTKGAIVKEGIYEFMAASEKTYVGQSANITKRLKQHLHSGKLLEKDLESLKVTEVLGGKTAREVAEQKRINTLGGLDGLDNIKNPVGPARKHLIPDDARWPR